MRVALFVTCLIDQCRPAVGLAAARLLELAGCEVLFDRDQTCCGQPAANSGYPRHARALARRVIAGFERQDAAALVVPSGSCAAMVRHFPGLFEAEPEWRQRAASVAAKTHELAAFLTGIRPLASVPGRFAGRLTWHDACHGLRELGLRQQPRALLRLVAGAELVELDQAEVCCGFGGTFSVSHPELSVAMADAKVQAIEQAGVDAVVSSDVSCLMHLEGRLRRRGARVRGLHLAEVLAGAAS